MQIVNMRKIKDKNKPKLRAFFDIDTPKIYYRGFKLLESQTGLWVAMPSKKITEHGKEMFEGVIEIKDKDLLDKINQAARQAYELA